MSSNETTFFFLTFRAPPSCDASVLPVALQVVGAASPPFRPLFQLSRQEAASAARRLPGAPAALRAHPATCV